MRPNDDLQRSYVAAEVIARIHSHSDDWLFGLLEAKRHLRNILSTLWQPTKCRILGTHPRFGADLQLAGMLLRSDRAQEPASSSTESRSFNGLNQLGLFRRLRLRGNTSATGVVTKSNIHLKGPTGGSTYASTTKTLIHKSPNGIAEHQGR
jgi:hypothetical protein